MDLYSSNSCCSRANRTLNTLQRLAVEAAHTVQTRVIRVRNKSFLYHSSFTLRNCGT